METSLYHDEGANRTLKLKRPMTLDFASSLPSAKKPKGISTPGMNLLSSPDLKLLQLASPELERMIIQQNGMVTTTPTPTQFLCPKYVTEEQEAYARGFVDALNELHSKKNPEMPNLKTEKTDSDSNSNSGHVQVTSQLATMPAQTFSTAQSVLPSANTLLTNASSTVSTAQQQSLVPAGVLRLKEEPQTVPSCSSPPQYILPIDMEEQEGIKLERKRERNRLAARKCRNRKLDRISKLEERVDELKDHNTKLSTSATTLRDQVCKLKQQIMEHVSSGCQVMLSQNIL